MEIQEIYENAKKDPSLFSSINMEELLDKIENETTEYLENKTLSELSKIVFTALPACSLPLASKSPI
jgi:predicted house-cleaning noncanonical NTP pyrophosphatase (MazG superfamily)